MEGSSGFQGPMQAHYQYLYQPLHQPTGQTSPLQNQPPPLQGQLPPLHPQPPASISASKPPKNGFKPPKWTDEMVKLMITAISYLIEAANTELDSNKSNQMTKATKWKVISMVINERGHHKVTPQQCEHKFLEVNKKYKQLIGLLGKSTSCKVFENPNLLETLEIPNRKKDEVRKLLESDQFFYQELCSLHHKNRLFIPHDWEVRRSVFLGIAGGSKEKIKETEEEYEREVLRARWAQLEEKKLEIQEKRLWFEKRRFEWFCLDHDEEMKMEKMRLENEEMKFANARLAFELKRREMGVRDNGN